MARRPYVLLLVPIIMALIALSNYTASLLENRIAAVLCLSNSYEGRPRYILVPMDNAVVKVYINRGDVYYAHIIAIIGKYDTETHKWILFTLSEKIITSEGRKLISGYRFEREASDIRWNVMYFNTTRTYLLIIMPYVMYRVEQYSLFTSRIHMDLHCGTFYQQVSEGE